MYIRDNFPREDFVSVFIKPMEGTSLQDRILGRADLAPEKVKARLESYKIEMGYVDKCDLVIDSIEGDIPTTYENFKKSILEFIE